MPSRGGEEMRGMLGAWSLQLERLDQARKARDKVEGFLDQFTMFFRYEGGLYATDDAGRRTFYDLKNGPLEGDEPLPEGFKGFAAFTGVDLKETLKGGGTETVKFRAADLKGIEVVGRRAAADVLSSAAKGKAGVSGLPDPDPEGEMPGGRPLPED